MSASMSTNAAGHSLLRTKVSKAPKDPAPGDVPAGSAEEACQDRLKEEEDRQEAV
ncbi:hypothetical protein BS78_08G072600 [Paspalum vaginatum]|nr:hypothetical protein BS78_08G072600 [Paspalum vaginatum]